VFELPRPRVYFEEWDEPLISGIGWVSEGDQPCRWSGYIFFDPMPKLPGSGQSKPWMCAVRTPQIIFVSWCGKRVDLRKIAGRPGWPTISAVRNKNIYSIDSADILQPGPGILAGVRQMAGIIETMAAIVRRFSFIAWKSIETFSVALHGAVFKSARPTAWSRQSGIWNSIYTFELSCRFLWNSA